MIETKVFNALSGTTYITDVVSTRIYPLILPQNTPCPCISYLRIDTDKLYSLDGYVGLENVPIQIDGWATSYTGIKDLSTRIAGAMSSSVGFNCTLKSDVDIVEVNENNEIIYRVTQSYSCWNRE